MKTILLTTILFLFSAPAFGQASLDLSAGAILNNPAGTQDFYYSIAGKYRVNKFELGLDVFGDPSKQNPKQPTRGAATATFKFFENGEWDFSVGGGGFKWGNEVGGFGVIEMQYKNLQAWGRVGSQSYTEAGGFYPIFKSEHVEIGPTFVFARMENIQDVKQAGIKLRIQ